mmetsp:Transcript_31346/g.55099  ORF Transcript_31346/g.55099 Transcript_31346/m.55099 type:complete len:288 (+) Transcript_31346:514-1377(+)|eukprot:CAMPEP_0197515442 /NCGR_PEP_ID=MMETSP1318-20131121/577_1 /TAXON_ID=552666 /ORGANISM="Partenskyella glossopodia, Strain RCC365" /LENGTH=287 /DNA_ID=CAMNT_0043063823 /DNA_START=456 /DNA_END=1319 /DNA_ORIENTATION=-
MRRWGLLLLGLTTAVLSRARIDFGINENYFLLFRLNSKTIDVEGIELELSFGNNAYTSISNDIGEAVFVEVPFFDGSNLRASLELTTDSSRRAWAYPRCYDFDGNNPVVVRKIHVSTNSSPVLEAATGGGNMDRFVHRINKNISKSIHKAAEHYQTFNVTKSIFEVSQRYGNMKKGLIVTTAVKNILSTPDSVMAVFVLAVIVFVFGLLSRCTQSEGHPITVEIGDFRNKRFRITQKLYLPNLHSTNKMWQVFGNQILDGEDYPTVMVINTEDDDVDTTDMSLDTSH